MQQLSRAVAQPLGVDRTMGVNAVTGMLGVHRLPCRAVIRLATVERGRSFLPGGIGLFSREKTSTMRHIRQLDLRGRRISVMHVCHKRLTREQGKAEQQKDGSATTKHEVPSGRKSGDAGGADPPAA